MSEYANYVEQAAYEDGLERGRQESRQRISELETYIAKQVGEWKDQRQRISELEALRDRLTEQIEGEIELLGQIAELRAKLEMDDIRGKS